MFVTAGACEPRLPYAEHAPLPVCTQDDVEILLFIIMHSYAPIYLALLLSNKIKTRFAVQCAVEGSLHYRKHKLFANIATRLARSIPTGAEFSKERLDLLGPHASDPLLLAVLYSDFQFMAESAPQALISDIWGPSELTLPSMFNMIAHPWTYIPSSLQLRWLVFLMSHLAFAALVWANGDRPSHPTSFDINVFTPPEVALHVFVYAKLFGELMLFLEETSGVLIENPMMSHHKAMSMAVKRFFRLDPWNVVDALTTLGMLAALLLRYRGNTQGYSIVVVLMVIPAFIRLLHVLDLHRVLGPLMQAMANQLRDVGTFLSIFGMTWFTFSVCFHLLFFDTSSGYYASYRDR